MSVAHNVEVKLRTEDIYISESITFSELLLSEAVLDGLTKAGFKRPSPIQLKAIPLGRCGLDLIVQAKSGTGKTCVFSVIALEGVDVSSNSSQVLVLAPTREIAIQISGVIQTLGASLQGLTTRPFIGGTSLLQDKIEAKNCHIAVGTPGRIKQLIELGVLRTGSLRLLVLDEADKLLEGDFTEAINWIYSTLPDNKQILALSATYPEYLANELTKYMRNPTFIRLNISDPALIGIKQYHYVVPNHHLPNKVFDFKMEVIIKILSSVSFQQCLIFSNLQSRAQSLQAKLQARHWPAVCIAGCLDQKERNFAIDQLKTYQCRILISTDLTARGIDADRVNLVINLDVPHDPETYLHRIGRAGRFGSYGAAISIVSKGGQDKELWVVEKKCKTHISNLPDPIPKDLVERKVAIKLSDMVSSERLITCEQGDSDPVVLESYSESSQAHSKENHLDPEKSQPQIFLSKHIPEMVTQQHGCFSNASHQFEHREAFSSELCDEKKVDGRENCDSPGLMCQNMEMNEEHEITDQTFPIVQVNVDSQSISFQACHQEECANNSDDNHISEERNSLVSFAEKVATDSKVCKDAHQLESETFKKDSSGETKDSQVIENAPLIHTHFPSKQDMDISAERNGVEIFNDGDISSEKIFSSTDKTKPSQTSYRRDKPSFRPLSVSHFFGNCHEVDLDDIFSFSSAINNSHSSSIKTSSSEICKIAKQPDGDFLTNGTSHFPAASTSVGEKKSGETHSEADFLTNGVSHFPAINTSVPEKKSREMTSFEACSIDSDKDQYPVSSLSYGKFPLCHPSLDTERLSNAGLINVCIPSIQNTENDIAEVGWKAGKDATLLAGIPRGNLLSGDEVVRTYSTKVEPTPPMIEMALCQEITMDKSVHPKPDRQLSKSTHVTVIPYPSEVKEDKINTDACLKNEGDTGNSGKKKKDVFSTCQDQSFHQSKSSAKDINIPQGGQAQISASVNALTFFQTDRRSQNLQAMYQRLSDCCSQVANQNEAPEKKISHEVKVPVRSLSIDGLRNFGHAFGHEISLLCNLKENLIKQVANIRKERMDKPKESLEPLGDGHLEKSDGRLNARLKEDEEIRNVCKEEILLSCEQKINNNDRNKHLKQGWHGSSEHQIDLKETDNVTTKDNISVDENKGNISFQKPVVHSASGPHTGDDQAAKTEPESETRVRMPTIERVMEAKHRLVSGEETRRIPIVTDTDTFQTQKQEDFHEAFYQRPSISNKLKSTKKIRGAGRAVASCVRNSQENVGEAQDQTFISQKLSAEATDSIAQNPSSGRVCAASKRTGFQKNRTNKSLSPMSSFSEDSSGSEDSTSPCSTSGGKFGKNRASTAPKHLFRSHSHKHINEQMQKRQRKKKIAAEPSLDNCPLTSSQMYWGHSPHNFHDHRYPLREMGREGSFFENSQPSETFPSAHPAYRWFSPLNPAAFQYSPFTSHWTPYHCSSLPYQPSLYYMDTTQQQFSWPFSVSSRQIPHSSVFQNASQMPLYASLYINHMSKVAKSLNKRYYN